MNSSHRGTRRTARTALTGIAAACLMVLAACGPEEPAVQDSAIDDGGMYEDGALEQVQPVQPEAVPEADSALVAPRE